MSARGQAQTARKRRLLALVPLAIFLVLASIFLSQLVSGRDSSVVPSVLIGAPAPATELPPLAESGLPGLTSDSLRGGVTLVNVWASWCGPCRLEHPVLMALAEEPGLRLVGINYKDQAENARRFLGALGNPYDAIGVDADGRAAIDWGVYGVPETFIIGPEGTILYKHVGPLTPETVEKAVMPVIREALAGDS
jgi:cytochrome c biogenesis protein CcmG/thiol:disulfide interchange protein DsbE